MGFTFGVIVGFAAGIYVASVPALKGALYAQLNKFREWKKRRGW